MGEIRLAVRSLLKSKLFAVVAIATLAVGIGATTAVFSILDAVAIRPLPFVDPDRLVAVEEWSATELCAGCGVGVSGPMLADFAARQKSLQAIATYSEIPVNVGGLDAPERVSAAAVSGNFFGVLGLRAVSGRALDPTDDRPAAPAVAVVSSRYFARRLASDPTVIGRTIRINGTPTTIVGVMPPEAVLPEFAQIWIAASRSPAGADRGARDLGIIGRLADGFTIDQANIEAAGIAKAVATQYPEAKNWTLRARSLRASVGEDGGGAISPYGLMFGAVIVLWAVVCANLAGLVLARGIARRREIAVRLAVGASRGAIVWHLFAESVCLAFAGGVLGVLISSWTVDLLLASIDTAIPSWLTPRLDATVLGFCVVLSLLSAAACGLLPAIRMSRPNVHDDLKSGAVSVGSGRGALRGSLVALQLALSLVLLAVSGVLTATIESRANRGGGYGDRVVQARIAMLGESSPERITATLDALVARLGALPEAGSAAASGSVFIAGFGGQDERIRVEGIPVIANGISPRFALTVTPGYFETTAQRIVEGRPFADSDRPGREPVIIIGRRLAGQLWPGRSAVGHRIRWGADSLPWRTIVGVIAESDTSARASNLTYLPFAQSPTADATLLVRARGDPAALIRPIRQAAASVDGDLPLLELMTSAQANARTWRPYKAFALTISTIGALALLLSAVGLYGLIAYGAQQRTREIGLRIALGAPQSDVVRLVTRQGAQLVAAGLGFGAVAAAAVLPLMRNMIFGLNPFNPAVFAASAAILVAVAALASYLPARRAAATSPMVALRSE